MKNLKTTRDPLALPRFIAAAALCLAPSLPALAAPAEAPVKFARPGPGFFDVRPGDSPLLPAEGHVLAGGRFSSSRFAVENLGQVTVRDNEGRSVPLLVDTRSVVSEFDEIISLKLFFNVPAEHAAPDAPPQYFLVWGPDISAENGEFADMSPDPDRPESYLEIEWQPASGADGSEEMSVTTIEIIADSQADYYALWYLLPMALLFALLTIRKISARAADKQSSQDKG